VVSIRQRGFLEQARSERFQVWLASANRFLFWLNLTTAAATLGVAAYFHVLRLESFSRHPTPGFVYYPSLASVRLYDVFHPFRWKEITARDGTMELFYWTWSDGMAIGVLEWILAITLGAWLLQLLFRTGRGSWFRRLAVATALLALPSSAAIRETYFPWRDDVLRAQDPVLFLLPAFGVNLLVVLLASFVAHRRGLKVRTLIVLASIYSISWMFFLNNGTFGNYPRWWGFFKCTLLLGSCVVAILTLRIPAEPCVQRPQRWAYMAGVLTLLALVLTWIPQSGERLANKRSSDTRIEIREGCAGGPRCGEFRIVISSDRRLEFDGRGYVGSPGHHGKQLTPQQVQAILSALDACNYTALEPRAFLWSFHARSVLVRVSQGDKSWLVYSDYRPLTPGPQQGFLDAASAIPKIAGIEQWIKCDDECRQRPVRLLPSF
jgi:hypothetical protein